MLNYSKGLEGGLCDKNTENINSANLAQIYSGVYKVLHLFPPQTGRRGSTELYLVRNEKGNINILARGRNGKKVYQGKEFQGILLADEIPKLLRN